MTQSENNNNRPQGQRKKRHYNKRRRGGHGSGNGNRTSKASGGDKKGNFIDSNESNTSMQDDQSQLLPQTVTVKANDFTQAKQEAMLKLNIHDESLLSHEVLE